MSELTPFKLLQDLNSRVLAKSVGLPEQDEIIELWSGIGFRMGENYFVAPMSEITELLRVPSFTHLPNVQSWVLGVSNIRGRLVPIVDLNAFFSADSLEPMRSRRVLVLDHNEQLDGLVVDGVEGMQHFSADTFIQEVPEVPEPLRDFILGYFVKDQRIWSRFSMKALSEHEQFRAVAG